MSVIATPVIIAALSIIEDGDVLRRSPARKRLQEGVDVHDVLIGQDGFRISRHVAQRLSQHQLEALERQLGFRERRRHAIHRTALAGAAMAVHAADREIDALAVGDVSLWRVFRACRHQERSCNDGSHPEQQNLAHGEPQRGSVTTSTSAGSPRFTAANARLIAGPRSFGSMIGPSPYTPKPLATVA